MALFRQCSSCRKDIACGAVYWVCSVSTCTRKRTGLFFCSVPCWEAHLPSMRHREAWAVEERAPSAEAWAREKAGGGGGEPVRSAIAAAPTRPIATAPRPAAPTPSAPTPSAPTPSAPAVTRRVAGDAATPGVSPSHDDGLDREILIVVSKLKNYIRERSGFNTSDSVMDPLSDCVRAICDKAIRIAGADGRRTVMDRDIRAVDRS